MTDQFDAEQVFESHRARLQGLAYRMTGSVHDAEDLCQEAWLRWQAVDYDTVLNPEAFLVTTLTRLAIDRSRSATVRRENYVGPNLPEPILGNDYLASGAADPAELAELADSLTYAFLVLLDELGPVERAVFLLHDVFSYPFAEVSEAVGSTPEAVRQMASRARRKVAAGSGPQKRPDQRQIESTLGGLLAAIASGDIPAVMQFLAPDVVELADGGGIRRAGMRPVVGPDRVARLLVNLAKRNPDLSLTFVEINARPGLLFSDSEGPYMAMSAEIDTEGRVYRLFSQLNPEKLSHL